jgi:Escherichia/Staphylococcus phage prohead protease
MSSPNLRPGEHFVRTFAPLLEVRSAARGGDGRTIEGIAVPFLRRQRIDDSLTEQFAPGAFDHQIRAAHRVFFTRDHMSQGGTLIGKAIELRNDAAGLWGAFRVSATPMGDETLALIEDGVLSELSVGFRAQRDHLEPDGTVTRVRADLREVSVVMAGAYGEDATIMAVRSGAGAAADQGETTWQPEPRRVDQVAAILAGMRELPQLPDDAA